MFVKTTKNKYRT